MREGYICWQRQRKVLVENVAKTKIKSASQSTVLFGSISSGTDSVQTCFFGCAASYLLVEGGFSTAEANCVFILSPSVEGHCVHGGPS